MTKRTNWDFSNHTHKTEFFKSTEGNVIRIDHLRKGDSHIGYVRFVNDAYWLSVSGDFGNWIFCRPFIPTAEGYVSDGYWLEKLRMNSTQEPYEYNSEETAKEIQALINGGLEEQGYEGGDLEKAKGWLTDLLEYTDDELEYTYQAYRGDNPTQMDYENIPFAKQGSVQLEIVFDAFDEICNRLRQSTKNQNQ